MVGETDHNAEHVIKSRFIDNDNQLKQIPAKLINIPEKDEVPKNSKISDVSKAKK